MENWREIVGLIAGVLALSSFAPYIFTIVRGQTKPSRVTWFTWAGAQTIMTITFGESSPDSSHALWVSIAYSIATIVVAMMSIWYGYSEKADKVAIYGIVLTLVVWLTLGATESLLLVLVVDAWGSVPTIKKSWSDPESEDLSAWAIGWVANTLTLVVLTTWDVTVLYPIYLFLLTGTVTILVIRPKLCSRIR